MIINILKTLRSEFSSGIISLWHKELPLAFVVRKVCQRIIFVFVHLKMPLFHLYSLKLFLLQREFWVDNLLFSFGTLKVCHCILASNYSAEMSLVTCIFVSVYIKCLFSLDTFKIIFCFSHFQGGFCFLLFVFPIYTM